MRQECLYDVIVSPVITEKSTLVSENNQIVFNVAIDSNKGQIKEAVERLFKVEVLSVKTSIRKGKLKAFKGIKSKQKSVKKAVVRLKDGFTLDVSTGL